VATILLIFMKINCPSFSRLVWRRHIKFQIGMAAAIPAIPLLAPLNWMTKTNDDNDIVAASSEDQSKHLDLALSEVERIFSEQGMSYL